MITYTLALYETALTIAAEDAYQVICDLMGEPKGETKEEWVETKTNEWLERAED